MKGLLSLSWINTLPSRDLLDLEASFREEAQPCAGLTGQALSGLEAPIKLGAGDEHLHPPVPTSLMMQRRPALEGDLQRLQNLLLKRTPVIGFKAHLNPPHLNLIISAKTLFPNKVTLTDTGVRTSSNFFGRNTMQPITGPFKG